MAAEALVIGMSPEEEDLVWRSPMPLATRVNIASCWEDHDKEVAPMISALRLACHVLCLSQETTFTAACLLHRYHAARNQKNVDDEIKASATASSSRAKNSTSYNKSDKQNPRLILVCCILLACKTEEEPRRLRDFINLSQMLSWDEEPPSIKKHAQNQEPEPSCMLYWNQDPPALDEKYWAIKEKIVATEQHVLRWLAFDIHVAHVHRAVVALLLQKHNQQTEQLMRAYQRDASDLLNSVAIYSSRALSFGVLPLASAAVQWACSDGKEDQKPASLQNGDDNPSALQCLIHASTGLSNAQHPKALSVGTIK